MVSRRGIAALLPGVALLWIGPLAVAAWQRGLWGSVMGCALVAAWLLAIAWSNATRPRPMAERPARADAAVVPRLLLDAAPTPLLGIASGQVRALNRAARTLFATDALVLPPPAALLDRASTHLRHEGRAWRIDRVEVAQAGSGRVVAALIDVEQEERAAEARATAQVLQVLGHELLNGLAPIASLAESAAAAAGPAGDATLLPEILGTLARRAEGLQRFTEAYRVLARLPAPLTSDVALDELIADLARLFAGRWPGVALVTDLCCTRWPLDRDQISQALWALLQNAAEAATARADGTTRVTLMVYERGHGLAFDIIDTGDGIAPEDAERIFRPFHTSKPDGTGVGLSLARQIAHAHGGTLALHGVRPTTFRLVLPGGG